MGVAFLSRQFGPDVWHGDPNSCCDIQRQISKFHLSKSLPPHIMPEDKLIAKSISYYLTDHDTPVIGEICKRVLEVGEDLKILQVSEDRTRSLHASELYSYWSVYDLSEQFPNRRADWMVDLVCAMPGVDATSIDAFLMFVLNSATFSELLAPPLLGTPPDPTAGIVNGDPIKPTAPPLPDDMKKTPRGKQDSRPKRGTRGGAKKAPKKPSKRWVPKKK
jgi:hypothetical protein